MNNISSHDNRTLVNETVKTCCPYCGVGCGVIATKTEDNHVSINGDKAHPANYGRLCSKGSDLANTLNLDNRLLHPTINGESRNWDDALDLVSQTLTDTIKQYGPESIAFYVSGQLLTEDYYVVNKLVKGYLGTANIDTNSRLCMASSVAGHKRAFGSDTVPGCYEDLDHADLVILTGSNLAWCHPVLFQRLMARRENENAPTVIVIDPRQTATTDLADIHLPVKPGSDSVLFAGLLQYLSDNDAINEPFVSEYTQGLDALLLKTNKCTVDYVIEKTGLSKTTITEFFQLYASTMKTVTIYSQGINQSENGTDAVNSIINCHLATGRIGREGMGPFSVTGQPNAMGGREVGGLSNMLAAHMELDNETHRKCVKEFWQSPTVAKEPGPKAIELFESIASDKIKFIWIMATNPVDSMPNANRVRQILKECPFVVVSDIVQNNDTQEYAHVRLPSAAWGEKEGTVTNSERCISRQRALVPYPKTIKPDWWQICEVAKRIGFAKAFSFTEPYEIFKEHAALSAYKNDGKRDFDIGAYQNITQGEYQDLQPFYWPARSKGLTMPIRFFAKGSFYTPSGRAQFVPVNPLRIERTNDQYPLTLNTGRIRDQWHTMTRTGYSQKLSSHLAEPYIEIHPTDSEKYSLSDADLVNVVSKNGSITVRALITERQQVHSTFVPLHWSDQFASNARVDSLVSAIVDPISGQPASKNESIYLEKVNAPSFGFCITRDDYNAFSNYVYWAKAPCESGWRYEFASHRSPADEFLHWQAEMQRFEYDTVETHDAKSGIHNMAFFKNEKLQAAVFLGNVPVTVSRSWAVQLLSPKYETHLRHQILAGIPRNDVADIGSIICSCCMVGKNQIMQAIKEQGCVTLNQVSQSTQAGSNCGSCRSEINQLLASSLSRST